MRDGSANTKATGKEGKEGQQEAEPEDGAPGAKAGEAGRQSFDDEGRARTLATSRSNKIAGGDQRNLPSQSPAGDRQEATSLALAPDEAPSRLTNKVGQKSHAPNPIRLRRTGRALFYCLLTVVVKKCRVREDCDE